MHVTHVLCNAMMNSRSTVPVVLEALGRKNRIERCFVGRWRPARSARPCFAGICVRIGRGSAHRATDDCFIRKPEAGWIDGAVERLRFQNFSPTINEVHTVSESVEQASARCRWLRSLWSAMARTCALRRQRPKAEMYEGNEAQSKEERNILGGCFAAFLRTGTVYAICPPAEAN